MFHYINVQIKTMRWSTVLKGIQQYVLIYPFQLSKVQFWGKWPQEKYYFKMGRYCFKWWRVRVLDSWLWGAINRSRKDIHLSPIKSWLFIPLFILRFTFLCQFKVRITHTEYRLITFVIKILTSVYYSNNNSSMIVS